MAKIAQKHQKAFYEAQEHVRKVLAPYHHRCISQYITKTDVIETFSMFSKEDDAGEGRSHYRGIVTVWYGMDTEHCPVNFSLTENFIRDIIGMKNDGTWDGIAKFFEAAIPPLKKKEQAA